jgi:HTH-type transcriptional regulator / antitoxin HigA
LSCLIDMDNLDVTQKEEEANQFASDWLIVPDALQAFFKQSQAVVALRRAIDCFAKSQDRHSGIILGYLYQIGVVPCQNLRPLLVKVGSMITKY